MVIVVMGVTGSGKSTVGTLLGKRLSWPFIDGDDLHPPENVSKMAAGEPLTDQDRVPWLDSIRAVIQEHVEGDRSAIVACSALKDCYRAHLSVSPEVQFIFLSGDAATIDARLRARQGHFMDPDLLSSQFDALEQPTKALEVSIEPEPEIIVDQIVGTLGLN